MYVAIKGMCVGYFSVFILHLGAKKKTEPMFVVVDVIE